MSDPPHRGTGSAVAPAPLPPGGREAGTWTLASAADLRHLRAGLTAVLRQLPAAPPGSRPPTPEHLVLVASELATNALDHGSPPSGVRLLVGPTIVLLDAWDHDVDAVPALSGERPHGAGGFGLVLVQRLAQSLGWYVDGPTKHVWARFAPTA